MEILSEPENREDHCMSSGHDVADAHNYGGLYRDKPANLPSKAGEEPIPY